MTKKLLKSDIKVNLKDLSIQASIEAKNINLPKIKTIEELDNLGASLIGIFAKIVGISNELIGIGLDSMTEQRIRNVEKLGEETQRLRLEKKISSFQVNEKILFPVIRNASIENNPEIIKLWAGLLVSSIGEDDSNLVFVKTIKQLTSLQVKILNYICKESVKFKGKNGIFYPGDFHLDFENLKSIFNVKSLHEVDSQLDNLREIGLITEGFNSSDLLADLTPTVFMLNLYIKTQGSNLPPEEFWDVKPDILEIENQA